MEGEYYHTDESVEEYIKLAAEVNGQENINELKNYVDPDASVLELGSGPGSDWELLNQDFKVTGSDNSTQFLERLRSNFPKGEFLLLDASKVQTNQQFDAIYSNKVLHHLKDEELKSSIQSQTTTLNNGGIVCHTFWKGEGTEVFKGMFVNYHNKEELTKLFSIYFEVLVMEDYKEFEDNDSILFIGKKK